MCHIMPCIIQRPLYVCFHFALVFGQGMEYFVDPILGDKGMINFKKLLTFKTMAFIILTFKSLRLEMFQIGDHTTRLLSKGSWMYLNCNFSSKKNSPTVECNLSGAFHSKLCIQIIVYAFSSSNMTTNSHCLVNIHNPKNQSQILFQIKDLTQVNGSPITRYLQSHHCLFLFNHKTKIIYHPQSILVFTH